MSRLWISISASLLSFSAFSQQLDLIPGIPKEHIAFLAKRLPDWMLSPIFGLPGFSFWQMSMVIVLLLLGFVIRVVVTSFVVTRAKKILKRLGLIWGYDLLHTAAMPLGNLALAAFLAATLPSLGLHGLLEKTFLIIIRTFAAVSGVLLAYRSVDILSAWLNDKVVNTSTKIDKQLVPLFRRALKTIIAVLGAIFVLQNMNIDVSSLLASVAVGGLAFSFAAKDTVSNLFGSLTIFIDKPFAVGDWVVTSGTEGVVESIGFRSTRIRTFYNSLVTVPNNKFTEVTVDNLGMRVYRRCISTLQITYQSTPDQVEAFCNGIRGILKAHPLTRKDYYEVHFSGFGASSLNIMLYYFMKVPSWSDELRCKHEIYLDIFRLAKELELDFAYPTQTLHIDSQAKARESLAAKNPSLKQLEKSIIDFGPGGEKVIAPGVRVPGGNFAES